MARQRRHAVRRRRRGRFRLIYKLLAFAAVAAAVIVACVVFFRINEVTVEGNSRYTAQEIEEASGIHLGDNLITLRESRVAGSIKTQLPYVESVSIRRQLPDGVVIVVRERVAAASVDSAEGRWLISSRGRLLEPADGARVVEITGLTALAPYAGTDLQVEEGSAATLSYVLELLTELENQGFLEGSTALDCTATTSLTLSYDIYQVKLPRGGDYERMLRMLRQALVSEELPRDTPGLFDFTVKEGEVYFRRNRS